MVVALGDRSSPHDPSECQLPTLLVGMTRQQLAALLADARRRESRRSIAKPIRRWICGWRALLPNARTVGVPHSRTGMVDAAPGRGATLAFTLDEIAVTDDLDAVRMLRPRLTGLDAVLLPPDVNIVNEWSLKPLLLMTVRQGVPVLGGSTARYVEAGFWRPWSPMSGANAGTDARLIAELAKAARLTRPIRRRFASRLTGPWPKPWAFPPKRFTVLGRCFRHLEPYDSRTSMLFYPWSVPPQYPPPDHDHRAGSSAGGDGFVGVRDLPRQRPIQPAVAEPAGPVTGRATGRRPGIWPGDRGTGATTGHRGGRRPASNRHSGNARARCDRYRPERSAVVPVAHRQSGATGAGALDRSDRGLGGGTTLRFAAPVLLQPLSFSTSAPAPRLLGRVDVELSVAAAQTHWQRRLLWDLGGVLLVFAGAVGLAHWTGRRLSGAIRQIAGAIQRIKTVISPRGSAKPMPVNWARSKKA